MRNVLISVWALFFGFTLTMLSIGLQGPLVAVRAFDEGFDTSDTGLIMAGFYAGYLLGAVITPRLVRKVGHAKVFASFASIASGAVLLFASFVDPVFWFLVRALSGFCMAVIYVVTETWLNQRCPNEVRGKVLSLYCILMYFGLGAGPLLLNLSGPQGYDLFILASVLISFGIVPMLLSAQPAPAFQSAKRLGVLALFRKAPLGTGGIFMFGLAYGALLGAGPIFADKVGLTIVELSIFMAVINLGCLVLLWPLGTLADRFDRTKVLIAVATLSALMSFVIAAVPITYVTFLILSVGLFAGLSNSIYGLCLAITNDKLEVNEMVACGTTLFICFSVGMTLGPVISTEIMEAWHPATLFVYTASVHVLIAAFALVLLARRGHSPGRRQQALARSAIRRSYWVTPSWMEWAAERENLDR